MRDHRGFENKDSNINRDSAAIERTEVGTLVFTAKQNEVISIGPEVQITIKRLERHQARITVQAPKQMKVERKGFLNPWNNQIMEDKKS